MKTLTSIVLIFISISSVHAQPPKRGKAATNKEIATPEATPKSIEVTLGEIVYKPGNVFNDSQKLLELMQNKKYVEIVVLLEYYFNGTGEGGDLMKKVDSNVFLKKLLEPIRNDLQKVIDELETLKVKIPPQPSGATATGISLESLFPASKVADGLGSFIAERFKEELSQRYLEAFRDAIIKEDEKNHFSILLPETYKALISYDNVFDYKAFLTTLKEAFKTDLDNLASNSLLFVDKIHTDEALAKDSNAALIKIDPETYYLLYYIADFVINKLPEGNSPTDFFKNVEEYKYKKNLDVNILNGFQIVNLLERNLANTSANLLPERIRELLHNTNQMLAFSGLLIEGEKTTLSKIVFSRGDIKKSGYDLLNDLKAQYFDLVLKSIADLRQAAVNYRGSDKKFKDVINLALAVNPVIDSLLVKTEIVDRKKSKKIATIVNSVLKIAELADQQKYGLVVVESVRLLDSLNFDNTNFYKAYKKYGIFIANVSQAQSSQEVKEALEAAALPVGSYRIKRSSSFNISFNAFAGVGGGVEYRNGVPAGSDVDEETGVLGFAVPVGLAFSWSKARNNSAGSKSIFASIIDVGAITSFRLGDDETATLPDFTWENILAPGLYFIYGFKNSPLSFGGGVQYGPQLRSIDDTTVELERSMTTLKLMLVVDIPIFNFLTKTRD